MDSMLTPKEQKILRDKIESQGWESLEAFLLQLSTHQGIKTENYTRALHHLLDNDINHNQFWKENKKSENYEPVTNEKFYSDRLKFTSNKIDISVQNDIEQVTAGKQPKEKIDEVDGLNFIPAALSPVMNYLFLLNNIYRILALISHEWFHIMKKIIFSSDLRFDCWK